MSVINVQPDSVTNVTRLAFGAAVLLVFAIPIGISLKKHFDKVAAEETQALDLAKRAKNGEASVKCGSEYFPASSLGQRPADRFVIEMIAKGKGVCFEVK